MMRSITEAEIRKELIAGGVPDNIEADETAELVSACVNAMIDSFNKQEAQPIGVQARCFNEAVTFAQVLGRIGEYTPQMLLNFCKTWADVKASEIRKAKANRVFKNENIDWN